MHATAQDGGASSTSDVSDEDDQDDEDVDDEQILDIDGDEVDFPEPSQDADQWTDDEALLASGPSINTGKSAW